MGGMAAQIPIKNDEEANRKALEKVAADKEREAKDGHDGTWVAHPALVPLAQKIFDHHMKGANQVSRQRDDVAVNAKDLLTVPGGPLTEEGLRKNINVSLLYLRAWLSGLGCVPIHHLMEDAATAEISRAQLWQWRRHRAKMDDGRIIDDTLMDKFLKDEIENLSKEMNGDKFFSDAAVLFKDLVMAPYLEEFLTTKAYDIVLKYEEELF